MAKHSSAAKLRWKDPLYREKMLNRKRRNYTELHREKLRVNFTGKNNPKYKEKVGYTALHDRIRRAKGKAISCVKCGSKVKVQWANKDHKYKYDINDYISLCAKCHTLYDLLFNNTRKYIRKDNKSGYAGVSWCKDKKYWRVSIHIGKQRYNGGFKDFKEAVKKSISTRKKFIKKEKEFFWVDKFSEQ